MRTTLVHREFQYGCIGTTSYFVCDLGSLTCPPTADIHGNANSSVTSCEIRDVDNFFLLRNMNQLWKVNVSNEVFMVNTYCHFKKLPIGETRLFKAKNVKDLAGGLKSAAPSIIVKILSTSDTHFSLMADNLD